MIDMLTDEQQKTYVNQRSCPICSNKRLSAGSLCQYSDRLMRCLVVCKACGHEWLEVYQLVKLEEFPRLRIFKGAQVTTSEA